MFIDIKEKEIMIGALDDIIEGRLDSIDRLEGICKYLYTTLEVSGGTLQIAQLINLYHSSWVGFSGDLNFPIPTFVDGYEDPLCGFYSVLPKWEGNQLRLRQSLAAHLKDCLLNNN